VIVRGDGSPDIPRRLRDAGGKSGHEDILWQTGGAHLECENTVEAEQGKIGKVFFAQGLAMQMGVEITNAREPFSRGSVAASLRQLDPVRVANDDLMDVTAAVDQDSDLSADFPGKF
jgi:hypothetical protein